MRSIFISINNNNERTSTFAKWVGSFIIEQDEFDAFALSLDGNIVSRFNFWEYDYDMDLEDVGDYEGYGIIDSSLYNICQHLDEYKQIRLYYCQESYNEEWGNGDFRAKNNVFDKFLLENDCDNLRQNVIYKIDYIINSDDYGAEREHADGYGKDEFTDNIVNDDWIQKLNNESWFFNWGLVISPISSETDEEDEIEELINSILKGCSFDLDYGEDMIEVISIDVSNMTEFISSINQLVSEMKKIGYKVCADNDEINEPAHAATYVWEEDVVYYCFCDLVIDENDAVQAEYTVV